MNAIQLYIAITLSFSVAYEIAGREKQSIYWAVTALICCVIDGATKYFFNG